jgi:hypothetical protein
VHKVRGSLRRTVQPFALDVKGGEMKDILPYILPSMPKGEIVGDMAKTEDEADGQGCH